MATPPASWTALLDEDELNVMRRYARPRRAASGARRPALVVIDVVDSFVGPDLPVGQAQEYAVTACGELAWEAVPQIRALLDEWRRRELPVAFSTVLRLAPAASSSKEQSRDGMLRSDAVIDQLEPGAGEFVFPKSRPSAFFGTPLPLWLRQQDADAVVLSGCTTSGCIRASAVDAYSYGFETIVAHDACFDRIRSAHDRSMLDLSFKYARVLASADLLSVPSGSASQAIS